MTLSSWPTRLLQSGCLIPKVLASPYQSPVCNIIWRTWGSILKLFLCMGIASRGFQDWFERRLEVTHWLLRGMSWEDCPQLSHIMVRFVSGCCISSHWKQWTHLVLLILGLLYWDDMNKYLISLFCANVWSVLTQRIGFAFLPLMNTFLLKLNHHIFFEVTLTSKNFF